MPGDREQRTRDEIDTLVEVARLCRLGRIRALAACGPVLDHFGLKLRFELENAAVLVDPASTTHLIGRLVAAGWVVQRGDSRRGLLPPTRATLRHPSKSCGLDVYYLLPGFLADPEVAFDVLWERHAALLFDGALVPSLDRGMNALTIAMYGAGKIPGTRREDDIFEFVIAQIKEQFEPAAVDDLIDLISELHGTTAMRPILSAWHRDVQIGALIPQNYVKWRLKVDTADPVLRVLLATVEAPKRQHLALAREGLQTLGRTPSLAEFGQAARAVLSAKGRLRDFDPADPRGSGWADAAVHA